MSNKRNLSVILGIAGATVLAAGGSAFVTDTALSLVDPESDQVQETEGLPETKETEAPLTVETFAATKDSFTIQAGTGANKTSTTPGAGTKESENNEGTNSEGGQSGSSSGNASSGGTSSSGESSSGSGYYDDNGNYYDGSGGYYDSNGLYHDEWGGYYAANGDYYDGNGGYWDGDGYHKVGGSSGSSSSGGSSGGSSSGSSSSGAWDDSYMMYDVDSRYVSYDELSGWSSSDLAKLRNEIFARHGRIFQTQKWIDYFATKTWYVPRYDNVDSMLNDYEWANLEVILKLEEQRS